MFYAYVPIRRLQQVQELIKCRPAKHRRDFICDDGDCHHHFFKVEFAIFQAILTFCGLMQKMR